MKHPFENYRVMAEPNFIFQVEEKFYTDYYAELSTGLYVDIERDNDRMKITGVDLEGNDFGSYVTLSSYFLSEYNKLERQSRLNIDNITLSLLEENKQGLFIRNIIAELQVLQDTLSELSVQPKYEVYKDILLNKLISFSELLQVIYQQKRPQIKNDTPKIKWLGTNKQLGTLFFDLWKGQKGTSKNPKEFKPIIEVDTKEQLMNFIFENFVNKKGEPLSLSSLSDQLNEAESKNDQRAKENRIELSY